MQSHRMDCKVASGIGLSLIKSSSYCQYCIIDSTARKSGRGTSMIYELASIETLTSFLISEEVCKVKSCHLAIRDRMSGS